MLEKENLGSALERLNSLFFNKNLEDEDIELIEKKYIQFRKEIKKTDIGNNLHAALKNLPENKEKFDNSPYLNFNDEKNIVKAILQMNYFEKDYKKQNEKYPTMSDLNLNMAYKNLVGKLGNIDEDVLHNFLKNIKLLMSLDSYGVRLTEELRINVSSIFSKSQIAFYDKMERLQKLDQKSYSKQKMFSHLQKTLDDKLKFMDSDHDIVDELIKIPIYQVESYGDLIKKRKEMLDKGSIYIKPDSGACASDIIKLTYDKEKNEVLMNMNDSFEFEFIIDKDFQDFILDETVDETETRVMEKDNIFLMDDYDDILDERNESLDILIEGGEQKQLAGFTSRSQFKRARNFNVEKINEMNYKINLDDSSLDDFLLTIHSQYILNMKQSYSEMAINNPMIDGKTWEIRQININVEDDYAKPFANYVKMGENDFIANISQGGQGQNSQEIATKAYQTLGYNPEESEKLAKEYVTKIEELSQEIVYSLSDYFNEKKNENFPNYKEEIKVDSISTDFMAEIVEHEDGKKLEPVLMDTNLFYGFSGLSKVNEEKAKELESIQLEKLTYNQRKSTDDYSNYFKK